MSTPIFLDSTTICQSADQAGFDADSTRQLLALAQRIAADETLLRLAEALYDSTYPDCRSAEELTPERELGGQAAALYLLIGLDAVRRLRLVHEQRGIPAAVTRACSHVPGMCMRRYAQLTGGELGIERSLLWWLNFSSTGNLYRLGRMEYVLQPFDRNVRVYRHRVTGAVQLLAEHGARFTNDGLAPFGDEVAPIWEASLVEDAQGISGAPISVQGRASPTIIHLPAAEWELRLVNGDCALDMHIPDRDPLTLDLLADSLQQALAFFPRYHPEQPFKAFSCDSWLFNPQLAEWLSADSTIVAFQRQGYLFPLPSSGDDGLYFVFGRHQIDLTSAPRDTRLRRAMLDALTAGLRLHTGGFLLLPEDVNKFGQEPYRTQA